MRSFEAALLVSLAVAGGVVFTHPGLTQTAAEHRFQSPDQMRWQPGPPGMPPGGEFTVLRGDPTSASGDFIIRFKAPPGYHVPPHTHPTNENLTVVSGSLMYGVGAADRSQATALPTGSYVYLAANAVHTIWAGEQGVVLEVHAPGPFGITYVNPADDPRKK